MIREDSSHSKERLAVFLRHTPGIKVLKSLHMDVEHPKFEKVVEDYYAALYRFALSLSKSEADASDLTQQTFYLWATKGHQLRDKTKVKSWLFTTLHREFLGRRRRETRFPHHDVDRVERELPTIEPGIANRLDAGIIMNAISEIEEPFRAPLILFYLQEHSYLEIATILNIPTGTVMSRLSRAKAQLRNLLAEGKDQNSDPSGKIIPLNPENMRRKVL